MESHQSQLYAFSAVFAAVIILTFFIFLPYISLIAIAAVFAVLFYPLHRRVIKDVTYESLAAFLTLLLAVLMVVVPLVIFAALLWGEVQALFASIGGAGTDPIKMLDARLSHVFPHISFNFSEYAKTGIEKVAQSLGGVFSGIAQTFVSLFIGMVAFFYFLKEGPKLREMFHYYSPLDTEFENEILDQLKNTINAVIKGSLTVSVAQGFFLGLGFFFIGIPNPVFWAFVAMFAALLPGVGTSVVYLPAVLYLYFVGQTAAAIELAVWWIVAVGSIDNFLAPYLWGRGFPVHPFLILLSVIGGIGFFGPTGLILGPLVLSLLFVLGGIFPKLVKGRTS